MNDCCRLCSSRGNPMLNIFSKTGINRKLTEKINLRLQIFVSEEDFLSKVICYNCCGKLDIFDSFVKEVHNTQALLTKQTLGKLKNSRVIKNEDVVDLVEDDDVIFDSPPRINEFMASSSYDSSFNETIHQHSIESDNHVSVIRCVSNNSKSNIKSSISNDANICSTSSDNTRLNNFDAVSNEAICDDKINNNHSGNNDIASSSNPTNDIKRLRTMSNDNNSTKFQNSSPKVTRSCAATSKLLSNGVEDFKKETPKIEQLAELKKRNRPIYYDLMTRSQLAGKIPVKRPRSNSNTKQLESTKNVIETRDFWMQTGNTLLSDLKSLKNSLLLRKVPVKNASVLTIPIDIRSNAAKRNFFDSSTDKGCQTEILLGAKCSSGNTMVYQKISFEGRSFLEIGSESNAIITSTSALTDV